jgi:hypothetical protein
VIVFEQTDGARRYVLFSIGAHPVVLGKTSRVVSADWPGRACRLVDETMPETHSLFFLGACGEVHPWIATQESPVNIEPVARAAAGFVELLARAGGGSSEPSLEIRAKTLRIGKTQLDVAVWLLGDARIVAAPVELFASLSRQLREMVGGPLFVATNTNGWTGYWPDAGAFKQGQYEVDAAVAFGRRPGEGEQLIRELTKLSLTSAPN